MKISVIGCGNIGGAIIEGLTADDSLSNHQIVACDLDEKRVKSIVAEHDKLTGTTSIFEAAKDSGLLIVAVKPQAVNKVLAEIKSSFTPDALHPVIVSVVAGVRMQSMAQVLGDDFHIVRVMPNLPCLIGQGMSVVYAKYPADIELIHRVFSTIGMVAIVSEENDLDSATGLSGSGPAFVFTFIEALADGGVKMGLSRQNALLMAAQTVHGASALLLESDWHPGELKDMVASPGGTTIFGLHSLEKSGFRGVVMDAVESATNQARSIALSKSSENKLVK